MHPIVVCFLLRPKSIFQRYSQYFAHFLCNQLSITAILMKYPTISSIERTLKKIENVLMINTLILEYYRSTHGQITYQLLIFFFS